MTKKIFITLIFLVGLGLLDSKAQKIITDSLEEKLIKYKTEDTIKVNLLNKTAYKLYQIDAGKTLKYAEQAGKLSDKLNFARGKSESLRLIGIYNILRGNYSLALENFQQSLEIALRINDKIQISKSYNNIGLIYDFYEDYQKELEYYQKSLRIDKKIGNRRGISISYSNIGLVYKTLKDYSKALEYLHKSLQIFEELHDEAGISRAFNNIGTIYSINNDDIKALEYLHKSLEISARIGTKSTEGESYKNIGIIFFKQKKYKKAYFYSTKAYYIAQDIEEAKLLKESAEILAKSSAEIGLYKQAYKYYVLFKLMNDSLYNDENTKKIASIEYQYKYEQEKNVLKAEQQKKDVFREAEERQQKIIRNSFIAGFILMFLLVLLVYVSFLQKRKANKILLEQKNEIQEINYELVQTNEKLNSSLEIVNLQKEEIEKNHNNINASINYASRIQQALLPAEKFFTENFGSHFILYKPKDIVSGDFYYLKRIENNIIVAVADCTGHGVPGAFVSMLGIAFLNEIVRKREVKSASQILEELRKQVKTTLKDNTNKDGMDIAMCVFNTETKELQFSGANNPLYLFRNNELIEIKATRNPIGVYFKDEEAFKNNEIQLKNNDTIYMFTDGYTDQFGGSEGQKFMFKRFHEILKSVQNKSLKEQKEILNQSIEDWKGNNYNQIDDILILGIKI